MDALNLAALPRLHQRLDHRALAGLAVDVGAPLLHTAAHLPQRRLQARHLLMRGIPSSPRLLRLPPALSRSGKRMRWLASHCSTA